jgi:hypothetical protein
VAPVAKPATGAPGFVDEVESGDRKRTLLALRRHIAERIEEGVPARDLAALSLRLVQLTEELDAFDADDGTTPEDELARRRATVLSAARVDGADVAGDARASSG